MEPTCTCTAYEAGGGLVGTKCLLYWPLSWHLLALGLVCLLVKQSSFCGKEVLLPSDHGQGLAHQEASSTISEPLFQDKLLAKAANGEKSSRPRPPLVWLDAASTAYRLLTRHLLGLRTHHA